MVNRVTERTDGVTAERVTETGGGETVVVDRGSGGSGAGLLIGLAVLLLIAVAAFYLINDSRQNEALKTDAITGAADAVGDSAKKVGDAAEKAADKVAPPPATN